MSDVLFNLTIFKEYFSALNESETTTILQTRFFRHRTHTSSNWDSDSIAAKKSHMKKALFFYFGPYGGPYWGPYASPYNGPYTPPYSGPYSGPYTPPYSPPYTPPYSPPYHNICPGGAGTCAAGSNCVENQYGGLGCCPATSCLCPNDISSCCVSSLAPNCPILTLTPTLLPTLTPIRPSSSPTKYPTWAPTLPPTITPSSRPSYIPSSPSASPTLVPSKIPTAAPTISPTFSPSKEPWPISTISQRLPPTQSLAPSQEPFDFTANDDNGYTKLTTTKPFQVKVNTTLSQSSSLVSIYGYAIATTIVVTSVIIPLTLAIVAFCVYYVSSKKKRFRNDKQMLKLDTGPANDIPGGSL